MSLDSICPPRRPDRESDDIGEAWRAAAHGRRCRAPWHLRFGPAAHIVAQITKHRGREVYAFTREGDDEAQTFARVLGAIWAGSSMKRPPEELDAAIIFAPVGSLVPITLKAVEKGRRGRRRRHPYERHSKLFLRTPVR